MKKLIRPAAEREERKLRYIMFMPAFIVILSLIAFPFSYCLFLSFFEYNIDMPALGMHFSGITNYYKMIFDERFYNGLITSFKLATIALPLEILLGFLAAILIHYRSFKGERIIRISLIIPMVIPPVVVGLVWKMLYNPEFGVINFYLKQLGLNPPAWLSHPQWSLIAIAITDTWQWFPLIALILLAGFDSIPVELIEAAKIDGASYFKIIKHIFVPLIRPLILFAVILRLIDILRMFDIIYVMTGGGPGIATETLHYYAYKIGLSHGGNISYASSLAIFLLFLIEGLALLILKVSRGEKA
jgi:multiple sugar transport system permease protein